MNNKMTSSIVGGIAATMAMGAAAYMMSGQSAKARKKQLQKKAGQVIQAAGDVVDGLSSMMK